MTAQTAKIPLQSNGQPVKITAADGNRFRRLQAVRILDRLIAQLAEPNFTGHATIELHSHQGKLKQVKSRVEKFHGDDE